MKLSLPNVKDENFGKRAFLFTGAKNFNNLPLTVVESETFKRSAAERDISFYHNFDMLIFLGLKVILHCIFRLFNSRS